MNNTALTVFNFQNQEIRTIIIDGEVWWTSIDICKILDIVNHKNAMDRLDEDEKGVHTIGTPGGPQQMLCVNESGLYHLIFTSRKEEAKVFRRWVTDTVLPSIRKTGTYAVDPEITALQAMQQQIAEIQQRLDRLTNKPKQRQLPGIRARKTPEAGCYVTNDSIQITHEQEKALVLEYTLRLLELRGEPLTANFISRSYLKRFPTPHAQRILEELAQEERITHFFTPHAKSGKFTYAHK